jgi:hypothetical protein
MIGGLDTRCHGTGMLTCHCGGDQCYCDFNGEAECYGCQDCESFEDEVFYEDDPAPVSERA